MALRKEKVLSNGVIAEYWKVDFFSGDVNSGILTARLTLFKDAEHKDIPGGVNFSKEYTFPVTKQDLSGDQRALSYTLIKGKNDPMLEGSVDV